MNEKRAIGLVGCGRWGQHILRDLLSLGCAVTVVEVSEEGRRRAAEAGAARTVSAVDELPPVDGIVVATPTGTHAAMVEALLGRGVPIFVEKPLTAEPVSALRLARAGGGKLFVMDKWRYHPAIEALADIARFGELGPVLGLRTTRLSWGSPRQDVDSLWVLTPHDLSIALHVLGAIPPARAAVADRAGGEVVGMVGVLGDDPWLVVEVSIRHPEYRRETRLYCRDGVALVNEADGGCVQVMRTPDPRGTVAPDVERRPVSAELPLLRELRAFVAHLGGGAPPRSSAAEAAEVVRVMAELRALAGLDARQGDRADA